ncbi:DUF418 domain-containing protein [Propionibacteriaceae bacterium Y1923]
MPVPPSPLARRLAPDLARGVMLLVIALANVSWYLYGHTPGPVGPHPAPASTIDGVIQVVMLTLVDGRAFPMFSFLFAYGMVQFYTSRRARGLPDPAVRSMLNRRHFAMLVIGFLHALLLFVGDIVGAYALAGLVIGALFFFRRTKILKVWSIVLGSLLGLFGLVALASGIFLELAKIDSGSGAGTLEVIDVTAGQSNYLLAMLSRVSFWAGSAVVSGLVMPIPLLLMIGWMAARVQLLENLAQHRRTLVRIIAWTLPLGWAFGLVTGLQQVGVVTFTYAPWLLSGMNSVAGFGTGIGYACLFALVGARYEANPPRVVQAVSAVGQRSLSSYLWQSLLLAPLLSAWGFALGDDIGTWQAMLLATAVWLASVVICDQLARRGRRGPAEVVLRKITYGKPVAAVPPPVSPGVPAATPGPPPAQQPHQGFRPPPGPGSA